MGFLECFKTAFFMRLPILNLACHRLALVYYQRAILSQPLQGRKEAGMQTKLSPL